MSIRIRSEIVIALVLLAPANALAQDAPPAPSPPAEAPADPLRERAKLGFEKYNAGLYAEAIVLWGEVYRQSGREKGYRVAFNLARAYDQLGDATRAGDFYTRYVREVERRRSAGQTIEKIVADQEQDARTRLKELEPSTARILVLTKGVTTITVDAEDPHVEDSAYLAYVAPGGHVVTFGTGAEQKRREVQVAKGETIEVEPPPPPPPPPPPEYRVQIERPYSSAFLYIAGGAAVASVLFPIVLYSNTSALADDYTQANTPE